MFVFPTVLDGRALQKLAKHLKEIHEMLSFRVDFLTFYKIVLQLDENLEEYHIRTLFKVRL